MSGNASFVGAIPQHYDRHLGPVIFDPYARDLARRVEHRAGLRVLELACGTGILTRRLLERLPADAHLVATDLNGAMISHARTVVPGDARVEWREADAQALPLPDGSFDAVVCQFGFMFLPDRPAGLREAKRVLRPGGQFLFSVWDSLAKNPFGRIAHESITSFFPESPPNFYLTPFGWHDARDVRATTAGAGFRDVQLETVACEAQSESAHSFSTGLVHGNPVATAIRERGVDPDTVRAAVERKLAAAWGAAPCRGPMSAHVASARA